MEPSISGNVLDDVMMIIIITCKSGIPPRLDWSKHGGKEWMKKSVCNQKRKAEKVKMSFKGRINDPDDDDEGSDKVPWIRYLIQNQILW